MPKFVDHNARRRFVTEVAAELVAKHGVEALTVRSVAATAGCSTAVVSHYFADKRDLLRSTFRAAANRSTARFEAATGSDQRTVAGCLEALLPLDEDSRRDWRVFMAFWGTAASDELLGIEQRDRVRSARKRVESLLRELLPPGRSDTEIRTIARGLITLIQGIASQAIFDPADWTSRRQADQLRQGLALMAPDADQLRRAG